jgi:hypothetical protein
MTNKFKIRTYTYLGIALLDCLFYAITKIDDFCIVAVLFTVLAGINDSFDVYITYYKDDNRR